MSMDIRTYLLTPPSSPKTQVIDHWLDSICGENKWLDDEVELTFPYEHLKHPTSNLLKRTFICMDDPEDPTEITPRPPSKRRAVGITAPIPVQAQTQTCDQDERIVVSIKLPSLHSSQSSATSSRNSSPSKRQRQEDSDTTYSIPEIKYHYKSAAEKWKDQYGATIPLLSELITSIDAVESMHDTAAMAAHNIHSEIDRILGQIEFCQVRKAPEDTWDNLVIYPAFQLAQSFAKRGTSMHVISAKNIPVSPKELLPTNIRRKNVPHKRIDYTVGLTFNEDEAVTKKVLAGIQDYTFNQSIIPLIRDRVLCSYIEIKTERNSDDGQKQLGIWAAAGFQKMENMWLHQCGAQAEAPEMPLFAPIPAWLWKEDTLHLYLAVMDSKNEKLHMIEERGYIMDRRASLLKIIRIIAATMDWGYDHYLPWFKNFIGKPNC